MKYIIWQTGKIYMFEKRNLQADKIYNFVNRSNKYIKYIIFQADKIYKFAKR